MIKINNFLDKPLNKFILWFLTGLLIIFIGIFPVKADSLFNNNTIHFYNNNGSSYNDVGTSFIEQTGESWSILTTVAGSYGGLVAIQLSTPLIQGHIYTLYLNVGAESNGGQTRLSAKNCLGIGGSPVSANNSYINCEITPSFSDYSISTQDKARGIYYTFIANKNGIVLSVPYTSQYTCNGCRNYSYGYTIQDNGDSSVLTQSQIDSIINNQTSSIQNQITQSQSVTNQTIIDSANNTDSNIINSANATQDTINNGLQTCTKQFKFVLKKGKTFDSNGILFDNSDSYYTEKYYSLSGATRLTISNTGSSSSDFSGYIILYDSNKNYLDYYGIYDRTFDLPTGSSYYRLSTYITSLSLYEGDGCTSKLDSLEDTLNDDDTTGATGEASDFFSSFSTNTFGLTSIITSPLNLIQSLTSKTCTPLHLPLPYLTNKYLDLPCMSNIYSQFFGNFFTLYQTITFGIVAYWVCVRIFNQVKDFKNPEHDEIEVLDL